MEKFMELVKLCQSKKVYIQTHDFPDPDAIASAYGLQKLLEHYGISSTLCYHKKIDKLNTKKMTDLLHIDIFPYLTIEKDMRAEDYIICVDSQRNGGNIQDSTGDEIACIDHHPVFKEETYLYSDIRTVGSCATLIAQYYQELGITPTADVATALLYGLKIDTGHFTRGVTMLDVETYKYLFPLVDHEKLNDLEKNAIEFNDLKAYGSAIENIEIYEKVGIASIPFDCPDALVALVADFILSLEEVTVAIIYSYREEEIKFSVRSENPSVHAGKLINQALQNIGEGGGHAEMAGGSISNKNLGKLGPFPDATIRERFLHIPEREA